MQNLFTFLFCGILAVIAYYDYKYKAIPLITLIIAVLTSIIISLFKNGLSFAFYYAGLNTLLIILQVGITTLYISARNRKFINILHSYLGIGDIMFFLVIVSCFSPINFIVFLISSGLITLVFFAFRNETKLIPLAGCQAICLCVVLLFSMIFKIIQPYNDFFLQEIF
jgi:hypothetical protein